MTAALKVASALDRLGFRRPVATIASLTHSGRKFSVDPDGRWINRQDKGTFASPSLYTASYESIEQTVLDNWCWGYTPKPGDTIIDVGAGIGEEAVVFSNMVGDGGRVISIEAHPVTFDCLERTIALSGLANVVPINCAIADEDGEIVISTNENHLASTVMKATAGIRVPARSLDSLVGELGIGEIHLLKMNIEGAEKLAVQGMLDVSGHLGAAVISCHDFLAVGAGQEQFRTKARVRQALEAYGFSIRTRPDSHAAWIRDYLYASRAA